ncbi:hypothetical protein KR018_010394 [Drosophila ironensis]|nr:hypothetical protein KR018_010394 [Drosophila ironensis]
MSLRKSLLLSCLLVATAISTLHVVSANVESNKIDELNTYMLAGVRVYPNDRQCVMVGGLCVATSDCIEPTTNKGLCPSSAGKGVECCYEMPVKPAPCAQHQGECKPRCHKRLHRPGTDCVNGEVCCVLI